MYSKKKIQIAEIDPVSLLPIKIRKESWKGIDSILITPNSLLKDKQLIRLKTAGKKGHKQNDEGRHWKQNPPNIRRIQGDRLIGTLLQKNPWKLSLLIRTIQHTKQKRWIFIVHQQPQENWNNIYSFSWSCTRTCSPRAWAQSMRITGETLLRLRK